MLTISQLVRYCGATSEFGEATPAYKRISQFFFFTFSSLVSAGKKAKISELRVLFKVTTIRAIRVEDMLRKLIDLLRDLRDLGSKSKSRSRQAKRNSPI